MFFEQHVFDIYHKKMVVVTLALKERKVGNLHIREAAISNFWADFG